MVCDPVSICEHVDFRNAIFQNQLSLLVPGTWTTLMFCSKLFIVEPWEQLLLADEGSGQDR